MFHPIRRVRRFLRTTPRKIVATVAALGVFGVGTPTTASLAVPDTGVGQFGTELISFVRDATGIKRTSR